MAFPTTLPSYTITAGAETLNGASGDVGLSGLLNAFEVDVTALGAKLGTGASTPVNLAILVGNGTGTSAWSTNLSGFTFTNTILITPRVTTSINDSNGNEVIRTPATTNAVNDVTVTNAATGVDPQLTATGDDTNINLKAAGKGTGRFYADLHPPLLYSQEGFFDFIASGGVWSGDSYGGSLAASMTAMVVYINGRRISIGAVTARAFTTNVDTYIDVLDNGDGTGSLVYTTAANNAASPSLAANSVRVGIIQAGATITAVGAVNQGQETKVLPIASSVPYQVTDSIGNLIAPRDPNRKLLSRRQRLTNFSATSAATQITELTAPVVAPLNRKLKVTFTGFDIYANASSVVQILLWDGAVSGTGIGGCLVNNAGTTGITFVPLAEGFATAASASKTFNASLQSSGGTATIDGNATTPTAIKVELE